jgi:hypothetical protein
MSLTPTRLTRRVAASVGALALVGGGVLAWSGTQATAGTTIVPLGHFLCYQARVAGPTLPQGLKLITALQPAGFSPIGGPAMVHCNPANKSVPKGVFKTRNPLAHLLCYAIGMPTGTAFVPVKVALTNQFGQSAMVANSPKRLCAPTWKDNLTAVALPINQPPGLDHLTCYPLTPIVGAYGFHPPSLVKAEDEFSAPNYTALKLGRANLLCVPTVKILPTGLQFPPQAATDLSLVCFPTSPTPLWKVIFDQNQFGASTAYPNTTAEKFCLPTQLSVQSPPG